MDKDRLVETLQKLIRIPSVSGHEDNISNFIFNNLEDFGLKPKKDIIGNVTAVYGSGKKGLMLNAHMDTVPPHSYSIDPYCGTVVKDKVYGLGASDCKAGLAGIIELTKSLHNFDGRIVLTCTVAEESTVGLEHGKGSIYIADRFEADGCIVAEPTMHDAVPWVSAGCRGRNVFEIDVHGKSTHSSRPHIGLNAVDEAIRFVKRAQKTKLRSRKYFGDKLDETLSVVKIETGNNASNVIPDLCKVILDYRTLPEHRDAIDTIEKAVEQSKIKADTKIWFTSPGYVLNAKDPVLKLLSENVRKMYKADPWIRVALGKADAEYFQRTGMSTIIFGPGINHQCHVPDEHASIPDMVSWTRTMENFMYDFFAE